MSKLTNLHAHDITERDWAETARSLGSNLMQAHYNLYTNFGRDQSQAEWARDLHLSAERAGHHLCAIDQAPNYVNAILHGRRPLPAWLAPILRLQVLQYICGDDLAAALAPILEPPER